MTQMTQMLKTIMKKRNVIIVTICVVISFILYQLYFFLTISSEINVNRVIPVFDHSNSINLPISKMKRSEEDKYINENGILRGVHVGQMSQYRPDQNNQFKCLKSNERIPFERVNDDYCDCDDGTDEPSTSACPNGIFSCDTQFNKKPIKFNNIPSSKLDDGICDCCDGSDEWLHKPGQTLLSQSSKSNVRTFVDSCLNYCHI